MTNYNINVYTYIHNFKDLILEIIKQNNGYTCFNAKWIICVCGRNYIKNFLKSKSFLHGEINEYNQSKA